MAKRNSIIGVPNAVQQTPSAIHALASQKRHGHVSFDAGAAQICKTRRDFDIDVPENCMFPAVNITIPDSWPYVKIAPLYDVHIGSNEMDAQKFERDVMWLAREPYTVTFNGGDLWDNAIKASIASSFSNSINPNAQFEAAKEVLQLLFPKLMFGIPGNHEDRTGRHADVDVSKILHESLGIPYSFDYMLCTIKWRGNKIRMLAHHGTGAAATPGGQRNSARKDAIWAHGFDLYWTGHLHQSLVDPITLVYFDQKTDLPVSKEVYSIISPSYLTYFGGYAAKKRLAPGARGLTVVTVQPDGRLDVLSHANGPRL